MSQRPVLRRGAKRWCLLVLLAGAGSGCTKAQFEKVDLRDAGQAYDAMIRDGTASDAPLSSKTCAPGTVSRSRSKAESCTCDEECQSGFCADGVCCSSACGERCKACNLPSSLGDCVLVPAGVKPGDPRDCVASTPATCGQDGTCDGNGGCRLYVRGSECRAGQCEGDHVANILTCDGKGQCSQAIDKICSPYTCDSDTKTCATTCDISTNAGCAAGEKCKNERCGPSPNGASCEAASDCASGFCVDRVCCNIACSGPCVSCDQTGSVGRCTYLAAGLRDNACPAAAPSTCGLTGLCDGFGSCTLYPENSVCGPSSCSGLVENTPRTCDGRGTCRPPELIDCAPFLCSNGACETSCDPNQPNACEPGHQCLAQTADGVTTGVCSGKRKNGQPCTDASQCDSNQCVDGVCCENACQGACRACNLPSSPGRCLSVARGARDPRSTCSDLGASACSTNGLCDGQGGCQKYPAGTTCGRQSCTAGAYTPPPTCNTAGQCVASRSRTCSPYVCNGDTCFTSCSTSAQCAAGEFCNTGSCGLKPRGADCTADKECQSGFCAQGVCCDSRCANACTACDLPASTGTCTAVADGAADPQGKCVATGYGSCGPTGACLKGQCAYAQQGMSCAAAVCASSSSLTPTSTCDGKGACIKPPTQSCGTFTCANGACKTSCTPATEPRDCVPPNTCVDNSCGLRVNGAACTDPRQCRSGFCTQSVCCDVPCADAATESLCKTCKGTPSAPAGTCAFVASGSADPKSRCTASQVDKGDCSNDGTCDGNGACRPWPSTSGCRQESCTGTSHTLPATCDGSGNCPAAVVSSCGSYVCSSTSPTCLTTCTSDADCADDLTCLQTTNRCGDKLGAGDPCVASSDCASGHCVDDLCCADESCADCKSCNVSGHAGTCYPVAAGSADGACVAQCPEGSNQTSGLCDGNGACLEASACPGGYLCGSNNQCATDCSGIGCSSGYECSGTTCVATGIDGGT